MTIPHLDIEQAATSRDRDWFVRNPARRYHVRGFVPGEFPMSMPGGIGCWFVVVIQIRLGHPDNRARIPFRAERMPADEDAVLGPLVGLWSPLPGGKWH